MRRLGAGNVQVTDGRVTFQGGAELIVAANLNLRTAERVLLLLATARTTTFDELFDAVYAIPWRSFCRRTPPSGQRLQPVQPAVQRARLPEHRQKGGGQALMAGHHVSTLPETGALYKLRFALRKDRMEMYLDTSGDGLHKRGYRRNATLAPIKETLAAAIADLGRVRRDSIVQDPFCGSGTLVIEAAQKALNIAPGLRRRFAAESFGFIPRQVWAEERAKAIAAARPDAAFEAFGYDIDPAAWPWLRPTPGWPAWGTAAISGRRPCGILPPRPDAIVLTNPPYGERLGDAREAAELAGLLGQGLAGAAGGGGCMSSPPTPRLRRTSA